MASRAQTWTFPVPRGHGVALRGEGSGTRLVATTSTGRRRRPSRGTAGFLGDGDSPGSASLLGPVSTSRRTPSHFNRETALLLSYLIG